MRLRIAALVLLPVLGLCAVGVGLTYRLLSITAQAGERATSERLRAIGLTAAAALGSGAGSQLLDEVRKKEELEAAYLVDSELHPDPASGQRLLNLLRLDPDRALRALRGEWSVGVAYRIEAVDGLPSGEAAARETVLAGYFPVGPPGGIGRVLVLEAGQAWTAAPSALRRATLGTSAVAAALALLCIGAVLFAVRATTREGRLYAQAQRGELLRQMAAIVAHEVRNPLSTVRAGLDLLREGGADASLITDLLEEVERMNRLTTEFINLAREQPLQVEELDLAALCDREVERLRRQHDPDKDGSERAARDLVIERRGESSLLVRADEDKLRQVLLNLLINAVQAHPQKGRVTVTVRRARSAAEVLVEDSGPSVGSGLALPPGTSQFQPFQTTKAEGTGLGLVISQRLAERHGGSLTLLSSGPEGTAFALRLPL